MRSIIGLFVLIASLGATPVASAAEPVPVALAAFDYVDTSGESQDQKALHASRLATFDETLREAVVSSGRYRVAGMDCTPSPCAAGRTDAATLEAAAREAKAKLLVYGGVHKMSTLVQWVQVDTVDVSSGALRSSRTLTFRGDSADAWVHAARYVGRLITE